MADRFFGLRIRRIFPEVVTVFRHPGIGAHISPTRFLVPFDARFSGELEDVTISVRVEVWSCLTLPLRVAGGRERGDVSLQRMGILGKVCLCEFCLSWVWRV